MAHRANKRPPGRIKSSIVARLNTRLFFRLLGIYFTMDLLLLFLFCGGLFVWSEQQAAQISTLVEERGVPSAEATEWMTAGDYTVTAGAPEADGLRLPGWLPSPEETRGCSRTPAPLRRYSAPSRSWPPPPPSSTRWSACRRRS